MDEPVCISVLAKTGTLICVAISMLMDWLAHYVVMFQIRMMSSYESTASRPRRQLLNILHDIVKERNSLQCFTK